METDNKALSLSHLLIVMQNFVNCLRNIKYIRARIFLPNILISINFRNS